MPRYLVVYYSWTGNTAKVARLIAATLSADIEEIRDVTPRGGPFAYLRAAFASMLGRSSPIQPSTKHAADYDVVILGCPVWVSNMATPMRSYITREIHGFRQIGQFCTMGGSGGKAALGKMATLTERISMADLILDRTALGSDAWRGATETFARKLQIRPAQTGDAAAA